MSGKVHRHPVLGFFAGLVLGLGIAMLLFVFGIVPMTISWLGIVVAAFVVLGVVLAFVAPARAGSERS